MTPRQPAESRDNPMTSRAAIVGGGPAESLLPLYTMIAHTTRGRAGTRASQGAHPVPVRVVSLDDIGVGAGVVYALNRHSP
jgi:hypothetical protein